MCYSWEDFETGCSPLYRPNGVEDTISFSRKNRVKEEKPVSKEYNYKPLPEYLTLKKSKIHGKGLFIKNGYSAQLLTNIGITHHIVNGKIIRTPLGGFINDGGKDANCILVPADDDGNTVPYGQQTTYALQIAKYQVGGDELVIDYSKWSWILDGSLYPPNFRLTVSGGHAKKILEKPMDSLLYGKLNDTKAFFSPYKADVNSRVYSKDISVNMGQEDTFVTKLTEFGENLINRQKSSDIFVPEEALDSLISEEYIGAPGGEERVCINMTEIPVSVLEDVKDNIRVKYLTQEDVEELGWVLDKDYHECEQEYSMIIDDYNWYGLLLSCEPDGVKDIEIEKYTIDGKLISSLTKTYPLFSGKIKNYNELKLIMECVGVNKII